MPRSAAWGGGRLAGEATSCWRRCLFQQGRELGQQHHSVVQARRYVQGRGHCQPQAPEQAQGALREEGKEQGRAAVEVIQPSAQSQHACNGSLQEPQAT